MKELASQRRPVSPIPGFRELRRIPVAYRRLLPLEVMKRHQCVVVGAAKGALTVAITDQQDHWILELLSRVTGCAIFPVWVHPARMRLLLRRLERSEQLAKRSCSSTPYQQETHVIMMLLTHLRGSGL